MISLVFLYFPISCPSSPFIIPIWGILIISLTIQLLMSSSTSKFKSTPTFTFKGRHNSITSSNDPSALPSPDRYNPEKVSLRKSPSASFAQSRRMEWEEVRCKGLVPGPGTHQPISYTTSGLKKTISKVLFKTPVQHTPSPTHYTPNPTPLQPHQPSFTMQSKTLSMHDLLAQKNISMVAPTSYEQPILKFRSASSITMAKAKRKSYVRNQGFPGPASYEAQRSYTSSVLSESKCKIGREIRKIDFAKAEKTPGPGSYEGNRSFTQLNRLKSKGFSCRGKFTIASPSSKVPGPGHYQTPLIKSKNTAAPAIHIPKSLRVSFTDRSTKLLKNNPGPGSFDLEGVDRVKFRSMSVHRFSKSKVNYLSQSINSQSSKLLSPGSYNANQFFNKKSSPKFSIGKSPNRLLHTKIQRLPGPGQYNLKLALIQPSEQTHRIQQSQRPNTIKHLLKLPGPGAYETAVEERLGTKFKFPKEKRQDLFKSKAQKQKSLLHETYQERETFPNPPKYMSVIPKLKLDGKVFNKK